MKNCNTVHNKVLLKGGLRMLDTSARLGYLHAIFADTDPLRRRALLYAPGLGHGAVCAVAMEELLVVGYK